MPNMNIRLLGEYTEEITSGFMTESTITIDAYKAGLESLQRFKAVRTYDTEFLPFIYNDIRSFIYKEVAKYCTDNEPLSDEITEIVANAAEEITQACLVNDEIGGIMSDLYEHQFGEIR